MQHVAHSLAKTWLIVGLVGQLAFAARFFIQWIASERAGTSVVPAAFWHLSLSGASLLLIYAIWLQDPVFILGQSSGFLIYLRSMVLRQRSPV
jgi:lipid-A-disaccharide synthase-like uncharacterized protein